MAQENSTKEIYALSIFPPEPIYGKLQNIIDALSEKYHDGRNAPKFKPHITLVSEIHKPEAEMKELCGNLANQIKPFKVKLKRLTYSGSYYRCVFQLVESPELIEANGKASEMFGLTPNKEYRPHLSLMYGEFDEAFKQAAIDHIYQESDIDLDIEFDVDGFWLDHSADEIPIEQWERVEEYKFTGK
jgi:2'-5' RNA ligase